MIVKEVDGDQLQTKVREWNGREVNIHFEINFHLIIKVDNNIAFTFISEFKFHMQIEY